jgi:hypothetical protein
VWRTLPHSSSTIPNSGFGNYLINNIKASGIMSTRKESMEFGNLDADKIKMREAFLSTSNRFVRRKCQRMDLDALGESLPFVVWLSDRHER